jgi:hypothetical protein
MGNNIALATAQFIGFRHASQNRGDIVGLVSAMGLTLKEWQYIKAKERGSSLFTIDQIQEIDEYYEKKRKKPFTV